MGWKLVRKPCKTIFLRLEIQIMKSITKKEKKKEVKTGEGSPLGARNTPGGIFIIP